MPADCADPARAARCSVLAAIAQRVCGITRIRSTLSRWAPSTSASSACGGDPAAGVAEDLGVAGLEAEHPQRVDPGVHAGDDRDAGVRDAVEAAEVEVRGELPVRGQQVVEVRRLLAHGPER